MSSTSFPKDKLSKQNFGIIPFDIISETLTLISFFATRKGLSSL